MGFQSAFNKSFGAIAGGVFSSKAITALTAKNKELARSEQMAQTANSALQDRIHSILKTEHGRKANMEALINEAMAAQGITPNNNGSTETMTENEVRNKYTETLRGFRKQKTEETNNGNK